MIPRNHAQLTSALLASCVVYGCARADSTESNAPSSHNNGADAGLDVVVALDTGKADSEYDGTWCGGEVQPAELVPLDLYIMLDASGSMSRELTGTSTKWDAVKQALNAFTADTSTAGLNLALQMFPLHQPGVPATCSSTAQCNGFGPCVQPRICDNHYFAGNIVSCVTADDCVSTESTGSCLAQGLCSGEQNLVCLPEIEAVCKNNLGECSQVASLCEQRQSCDVVDYATPVVPLGPRQDVAASISSALEGRIPEGATPTGPALQGAISYLQQRLTDHPDHRVAVVLVTDGLPTDCAPVEIDEIAGLAAAVPEVTTYVIGVFEDEQAQHAQQNLDAIASAGQTGSALIIKTSQNVAQEFVALLSSIREHTIACEYAIPTPTEGVFQSDLVNVEYAPGDGTSETMGYVASADDCGSVGGWYYDTDPLSGVPSQIRLCAETCSSIQGNEKGVLSIRLGCPTLVVK